MQQFQNVRVINTNTIFNLQYMCSENVNLAFVQSRREATILDNHDMIECDTLCKQSALVVLTSLVRVGETEVCEYRYGICMLSKID